MSATPRTSAIKPGDRVAIINRSIGAFFVEGYATVISPDHFDRWLVRFDGEHSNVSRFVDPQAQADPEAFVQRLNGEAA